MSFPRGTGACLRRSDITSGTLVAPGFPNVPYHNIPKLSYFPNASLCGLGEHVRPRAWHRAPRAVLGFENRFIGEAPMTTAGAAALPGTGQAVGSSPPEKVYSRTPRLADSNCLFGRCGGLSRKTSDLCGRLWFSGRSQGLSLVRHMSGSAVSDHLHPKSASIRWTSALRPGKSFSAALQRIS